MYRILKKALTQSASGQCVDSKSKGFQLRLDAPIKTRQMFAVFALEDIISRNMHV